MHVKKTYLYENGGSKIGSKNGSKIMPIVTAFNAPIVPIVRSK
jgi:hypothetical protein